MVYVYIIHNSWIVNVMFALSQFLYIDIHAHNIPLIFRAITNLLGRLYSANLNPPPTPYPILGGKRGIKN